MRIQKFNPGDIIGNLEIIGDTGKRNPKGEIIYKCKCICGNTAEFRSSAINETKSCGCKFNALRGYVEGTSLPRIRPDKPLQKNNTSGCTGVIKAKNRWNARIKLRQKKIDLGCFDTYEEAVAARKAAEEKYFKPILEFYT